MSTKFQELLDTLNGVASQTDDLTKSIPAAPAAGADENDEDEAAAGAGDAAAGDADDAAIQAAADEAGAGGEGGEFGKSFEFTDADGNKQQAVDATELVKSLMARTGTVEDTLAKALESFTGVVQKQGELIKSLSAQVSALSKQGSGRKSQLVVVEKPDTATLAKSGGADDGMSVDQFFAKANAAYDAQKITGRELATIDVCRRSNVAPDASLVSKVLAA